jgi:chromatin remodeling complex protein RSC6
MSEPKDDPKAAWDELVALERSHPILAGTAPLPMGTAPRTRPHRVRQRKPNAAFIKPVQPDATLAAIVGSTPLPRAELTKKIWAHIKKHGLQDKKVKTMINADDKLRPVFGGKSKVSLFEMGFFVSEHLRAKEKVR